MSIIILTDSTADLPKALVASYGLEIMPLTVGFGEQEYLDGVTISNYDFFEKLKASEKLPLTSQVTVGAFLEKYDSLLQQGHDILSIHLGGSLSGTLQSAALAKATLGSERIHLIDSLTTSIGLAALVIELAKMVEANWEISTILAKMETLKHRVRILAVIDDLTYLVKGGRLSSGAQMVCNVLGIKPVIAVENDRVAVVQKCRGLKKAHSYLMDQAFAQSDPAFPLYFGHAHAPQALVEFKATMATLGTFTPAVTDISIGVSVGTHVGPNCVGVAYFKK